MQEGNVEALGALAGSSVDQTDTLFGSISQAGCDVVGLESDVVYTTAAAVLLYEFCYSALFAGGFQKFQLNLTDAEEGSLDFLVFYNLDVVAFQAKYIFVIRNSFLRCVRFVLIP